jgi:hypothetical protein
MTSEVDNITLEDEVGQDEVALSPNESADPQGIIDSSIPADVREKYEIYSYRSAALIISQTHQVEFNELMDALRAFKLTTKMIRTAGGNESDIPKLLTAALRPKGWYETIIQGDLLVRLQWKQQIRTTKTGQAVFEKRRREFTRGKFLDGHKIDYVKNRVAFDLEWNSKDQTFDRDLYAFSAFASCGVIDVAVLVTRSASLNPIFKSFGPSLKKSGDVEMRSDGHPRQTSEKYGASTTWMGKLLYRLNAGRNGACPVLVIGITPNCIEDLDHAAT